MAVIFIGGFLASWLFPLCLIILGASIGAPSDIYRTELYAMSSEFTLK